jgi:exosortase B
MSAVPKPFAQPTAATSWSVRDYVPLALVVLGWLCMFGPSYLGLSRTIWASEAQGHGPIILAVSLWLLWKKKDAFAALERRGAPLMATALLVLGIAAYVLGRSQSVWTLEISAQIAVLMAILLFFFGSAGLRVAWFPLVFLVFMIPWPGEWVDAITAPMKSAVSVVATGLLFDLGYPVARSGVIISIGQYQLLVADACAGLNSLFTLEALGLLYLNLMHYSSPARNIALATVIMPISFIANVVRVVILVLVTYYFGDEAGQGFVHGFAGMVLFMVALALILVVDKVIGLVLGRLKT